MKALTAAVAFAVLLAGVALSLGQRTESKTITLTFVGDIMLGRSVAPVAAADPDGLFRDVRHLLRASDLSFGNLESPLTGRPHTSPNPNVLVAEPGTAGLLAGAGFDVVSLANNHMGDAGPEGVIDTLDAVADHGLQAIGAGPNGELAAAGAQVTIHGVRVAMLAFDATGAGLVAGKAAGVVPWNPESARLAVEKAATTADVVVVSVHGGVEYLPDSDPRMLEIGDLLVAWGADVVWGHGPHVPQPITSMTDGARSAIIATSLGNFLFDQRGAATGGGLLLQVLADRRGVIGHRSGTTSHHDLRVHFTGWVLPQGDAVFLDGSWWQLQRLPPEITLPTAELPADFPWGEPVAAGTGPLTGGESELVVSYRARPGPHPVRDGMPGIAWTDDEGFTMHLGVFGGRGLVPVWQAGMVPAPIASLTVCGGSLALAYRTLDSATVHSTGAATWRAAGLDATVFLPGSGIPACGDVDGDGRTDPLVVDRSPTAVIRP